MSRDYSENKKWHEITIVHNGKFSKVQILESMLSFYELYPYNYKIGPIEDRFLVFQHFDELKCLLGNELKLKIIDTKEHLKMRLRMSVPDYQHEQIDPMDEIMSTVRKRFNLMDRILNLNNLNEAGDLSISLSNITILSSVLSQSGRRYLNNITELYLRNNGIASGKGMHGLNWMQNLKVLDLRDNKINSVKDLNSIPKCIIKELWLDGNPLCRNYIFPDKYLQDVKEVFPALAVLDGVPLDNENSIRMQKNFLCSIGGYDCVEQFVNLYFTTYDSPNRLNLLEMYDENAIFSMSFNCELKKVNENNRLRYHKYFSRSKNIKKMANLDRAYTSVHLGKEEITTIFKYLPKTEHDFMSFTTDTTQFNEKSICITVTGVFKDVAANIVQFDMLLSFSRTFVLHAKAFQQGISKNSTEYKIVNEIYYISNATKLQTRNSFKFGKPKDSECIKASISEDKECFTVMFQKITALKTIWCTKYLDGADWDFKKAMHHFTEAFAKNSIPESAYM